MGTKKLQLLAKICKKVKFFCFSGFLASKITSKLVTQERSMQPKKEKSAPQ